jgi:copper chaperone CopZ
MKLLLLLMALSTARAEFLRIEVFMKDMNCASCSDSMGKASEKIRGVQHVEVSMEKGTVTSSRCGTPSNASASLPAIRKSPSAA